jgi:hypothetical protein
MMALALSAIPLSALAENANAITRGAKAEKQNLIGRRLKIDYYLEKPKPVPLSHLRKARDDENSFGIYSI